MAYDALLTFASGTVGTASMTHGTVDLRTGTPTRGLMARWVASAGSASSGTARAYPQYDHSSDASTWHALTDGTVGALSLTSAGSLGKEVITPINTALRYVRCRTVVVGGTSPTLTITADMGIARTP
jgi:hypothetical protein